MTDEKKIIVMQSRKNGPWTHCPASREIEMDERKSTKDDITKKLVQERKHNPEWYKMPKTPISLLVCPIVQNIGGSRLIYQYHRPLVHGLPNLVRLGDRFWR